MDPLHPENFFRGGELAAAQAIAAGNAAELERTLTYQLVHINAAGEGGMTLLLFALARCQAACLHALLRWGADPNLATDVGEGEVVQPVALAASHDDLEMLHLLLAYGGNPNSQRRGAPALFGAIYAGNWPAFRLLARHRGIDLNLPKPDGTTPVLLLAYLNHFEQVEYLLDRGADFARADRLGGTLAFVVQATELDPDSRAHHEQQRLKRRLQLCGVQFPVPDPSVAWQEQQAADDRHRRQWHRTSEGMLWQDTVNQAAVDEDEHDDGVALMQLRAAAEHAYEEWKTQQAAQTASAATVA